MSAHLAPGGVASQWLPLYQLSTDDVRTIVATWCAAFPDVQAWLSAYDLVLVGANDDDALASLASLLQTPLTGPLAQALGAAGVHSPAELCALFVGDDQALRAYAADVSPMRDDRPVLEFRAPLSYLAGYAVEPLRWAAREAFLESLPVASRERGREVRGLVLRFLERLPEGTTEAARRYGEELLALPPLN
jgi:spermidine synthase